MKTIAIIAAEEQELAGLEAFLENPVYQDGNAGCRFLCGQYGELRIAAMKCGIGKVNAAIGAQVLADTFHPDMMINVGSAGALGAAVHLYDIVISKDCVQHDFDASGLGYAPGVVPDQETSFYQADAALIRLAEEAAAQQGLTAHTGRIASGDMFVSSQAVRDRIITQFDALCAEMEGAAVAQCAYRNAIPFVIIRSMSDSADGSATVSYQEFSANASLHALQILKYMAAHL